MFEMTAASAPTGILAGDGLASGAAMAAMALASVGLWTLRVACAARGRKLVGAAVASVEALVFAVAFSSLAANLDAPMRVLGYAVGVAAGTLLGLLIDERGSRGTSEVQVVVGGDGPPVAQTMAELGWPVTSFAANGPRGPVTVAFAAVEDGQVPHVVAVLHRTFPEASWSIQPLRRPHRSIHPTSNRTGTPTRRRNHHARH